MIPDVEELCAKFHAHLFAYRKELEDRKIPVLKSRSTDDVASRVSEREGNGVIYESASIENGAGHARLSVGIADDVRAYLEEAHASAAVARGYVGDGVGDGEPISRGSGGDARNLPVADNLVLQPGGVASKLFPVSKWKLINVADHKAVPHVEIGIAVFQKRVTLITEIAVIERA